MLMKPSVAEKLVEVISKSSKGESGDCETSISISSSALVPEFWAANSPAPRSSPLKNPVFADQKWAIPPIGQNDSSGAKIEASLKLR